MVPLFGAPVLAIVGGIAISLVIAILLYAADTIFTLMQGTGALHGIIIRVIVFLALGRAFGAIRELKSQTSMLPPVPA